MCEISIIIPLYKVENYIERCLYSLVRQNYTNYEIILVDDFSQDNSLQIAERFLIRHDISFRSVVHKQNQKQGAARNSGLEIANGKYIYFMDADDELANEQAMQLLHTEMEKGDYDFVTAKDEITSKNYKSKNLKTINCRTTVLKGVEIIKALGEGQVSPVVWNKLIRKDFLIQNNIQFVGDTSFEDVPYCFILCDKATRVALLNQVTYTYYFQENPNATTNFLSLDKIKDAEKMCRMLIDYAEESKVYKKTGMFHIHKNISKVILYVLTHPSVMENKVKWATSYVVFRDMYRNSYLKYHKKYLFFPVDVAYFLIKNKFQRKKQLSKGLGLVKRTILWLPFRLNFG